MVQRRHLIGAFVVVVLLKTAQPHWGRFASVGDIYSGQWVNGKKHGHGSYLYKETGAQLEGKWSAGAVIEGTFTDSFGGTYTGEFGGSATELAYTNGGKFVTPAGATVIASSA